MVNVLIGIYIILWSSSVFLFFKIRGKMKESYPEMAADIFAPSLSEHNINKSLKFQKFSMRSSMWKDIDDEGLLFLLKLHRFVSVGFLSMLSLTLLSIFSVAIYSILIGQM